MTALTTTQASAFVELRRRGSLRPSTRAFDLVSGRREYSRRTLQALVDGGYAQWQSYDVQTRVDGSLYRGQFDRIVPAGGIAQFVTNYMDDALYRLPQVIERAKADLAEVDFDTIVGTGFSGGVVIPALALAMGKEFLLIRKDTDDSHHGRGRVLGSLGKRWIFVDDFTSSGSTRRRVLEKVARAAEERWHDTIYVGDYLYANTLKRWQVES